MRKTAITRVGVASVVIAICLQACTFSNNLHEGDYVQRAKTVKLPAAAEKADFYVTCASFARHYDQVVKSSDCNALFLYSILDKSVQWEILGNFHTLDVGQLPANINTRHPDPAAGVTKVVHLDVYQEYGWPRLGFQAIVSTLSLTLIPLNYPHEFTLTLSIENPDGSIVKAASRKVVMDNWWWMPLMFAYPFYNEKRASENILLHTGRDLVRELDP